MSDTGQKDKSAQQDAAKREMPFMAVRDLVVFPNMIVPLVVGRKQSVSAIERAMKEKTPIFVVAQKDAAQDNPASADLYRTGTICSVAQYMQLPDGTVKILVEGKQKAEVESYTDSNSVRVRELAPQMGSASEAEPLARSVIETFEKYAGHKRISQEIVTAVGDIADYAKLVSTVTSHLDKDVKVTKRQEILEQPTVTKQLEMVYGTLQGEIEVINAQKRVQSSVKRSVEKTQKEYMLREQMKAIQKELGEGDEEDALAEYEQKIAELQDSMPPKILEAVQKEFKKLKSMNPAGAEATVSRNYLDVLLDLPWGKMSNVSHDLKQAREVLDEDHYGLDKVKKQVLEHLAVQGRLSDLDASDREQADILCLVGPPGIGKTSICQSLAKATGREYVRMAVGGVQDEAEIRGHRRTYIGSVPGRIIKKLTEAGTMNPLFVIDEIDKMGSNHRGDPASAMLEVLDPEQNSAFEDHYLGVPVDLSKVKFVCTANDWQNIPGPLQDRMETIFLGSYTEDEKLEIAKRHLVRKQAKAHKLEDSQFSISEGALRDIVSFYTKESGVRTLQRKIKEICRKAVVEFSDGKTAKVEVTSENLEQYLGKRQFRHGATDEHDQIGVVTGLAWTQVGGETLTIEAVKFKGKDASIEATGSLRDVMKESITVAKGWLKSHVAEKPIGEFTAEKLAETSFHIHVPEGATPKDGPSAGAAMLTAIFSVATGKPVRRDVAMTGELTLRGKVTAIGGLREKLTAASRGGYKTVLIPKDNEKDLDDVPQAVKDSLQIVPVSTIEEVLDIALVDGYKPTGAAAGIMVPLSEATAPQPQA